jgi:hypothetical protein
MLTRNDLETLVKYTEGINLSFNEQELRFVFSLLNLGDDKTVFEEDKLERYVEAIQSETAEQNRIMTRSVNKFLETRERKSEMDAYTYLVENIGDIKSPFMLWNMVGFLAHHSYKPPFK